jgi:hypothetical protein
MTISEFHAWLDGYSASFTDGTPNADQWVKVLEKIASLKPLILPAPATPPLWPTTAPALPYTPNWRSAQ